MISMYDTRDIGIRESFSRIQRFTGFLIAAMCIISLGYFVFWLGAISDEIFYEYGRPYFEPLASLLNLGSTTMEIYANTM